MKNIYFATLLLGISLLFSQGLSAVPSEGIAAVKAADVTGGWHSYATKLDSTGNQIILLHVEGQGLQAFIKSVNGNLSAPITISTPGRPLKEWLIAESSRLELDGSDNAVALWVTVDPTTNQEYLESAILPAGGNWSAPQILAEGDGIDGIALSMNAKGMMVASWVEEMPVTQTNEGAQAAENPDSKESRYVFYTVDGTTSEGWKSVGV